jgi:hypothetical protein
MHLSVRYVFARSAGDWRRFVVHISIAVAALAAAAPGARAALPDVTVPLNVPVQLPLKDGAVGGALPDTVGGVVGDVVNEPLPAPVEDVVKSTPVAPVRDEVRRVVNQTTGGTGAGGGSGAAIGGSGNSKRNRSGRARRGAGANHGGGARTPRGAARRLASGITPGRGTAASQRRLRQASSKRHASGESQSAPAAAVRTIETVVKAVPTLIWIALCVLSLLALGLAGRTYVERRNARALARDREQLLGDVAALERALLPAVPEKLGAVCVSVAYRSCDGPAAGGDFYDAFELPGGRAAVIVGDVSGHGADALESTNSVRAQLHALLETGMTPRAAIAMLGERAPIQLAGRFSTVVVAVHDPAHGTLTYAAAGHAPPIMVGPGTEELLGVGASPPVGVGLRTGLRETTVALPPGSTCCFYTDGLVEAKNGEGMIGRGRLAEIVAELGPDEQADVLLERVLAESSDASDDMTVCVVRPLPGRQARSARVEVLELDADDVDSGFAARFLDVCDVPAGEQAVLVERARELVASNGLAVLEITIADSGTLVRVAPASEPAEPDAAAAV